MAASSVIGFVRPFSFPDALDTEKPLISEDSTAEAIITYTQLLER
jgi:uncharacterized protein YtpQ (UPF0354 family)